MILATEQEWAEERGRLGGYDPKWDMHDYDTYHEGGRYHDSIQCGYPASMASVATITARVVELAASEDPRARVQALSLIKLLQHRITLPDAMWCVSHHYGTEPGAFMRNRVWVFSAHYTETNARLWLPFIDKKLPKYEWQVEKRDDVEPQYLRRLEADPAKCIIV